MVRGLMSDAEWAFFEPFVCGSERRAGRPPKNHRLVLDGVRGALSKLASLKAGIPCPSLNS